MVQHIGHPGQFGVRAPAARGPLSKLGLLMLILINVKADLLGGNAPAVGWGIHIC